MYLPISRSVLDPRPGGVTASEAVNEPHGDITALLRRWGQGDAAAGAELTPLVYSELRRLAKQRLRRERADHSWQSADLVHEAYLRLVAQDGAQWNDRAHFFAVCARIMRRILVDHARAPFKRTGHRPEGACSDERDGNWLGKTVGNGKRPAIRAFRRRRQDLDESRAGGGRGSNSDSDTGGSSAPNRLPRRCKTERAASGQGTTPLFAEPGAIDRRIRSIGHPGTRHSKECHPQSTSGLPGRFP